MTIFQLQESLMGNQFIVVNWFFIEWCKSSCMSDTYMQVPAIADYLSSQRPVSRVSINGTRKAMGQRRIMMVVRAFKISQQSDIKKLLCISVWITTRNSCRPRISVSASNFHYSPISNSIRGAAIHLHKESIKHSLRVYSHVEISYKQNKPTNSVFGCFHSGWFSPNSQVPKEIWNLGIQMHGFWDAI